MRTHDLVTLSSAKLSSAKPKGGSALSNVRAIDAARRGVALASAADGGPLAGAGAEGDQLARDIADIERATLVLRTAEPALQNWSDQPPPTLGKPRPVWLIVGLLWISTALVTLVAVAAISRLVG